MLLDAFGVHDVAEAVIR
jgi:hypothetical protein